MFSSFHHTAFNDNGAVEVEVDTLDNYCEKNQIKNIDLLKTDVGEQELSVLKDAFNLLTERCIRTIPFEFGRPTISARIYFLGIYNYLNSFDNCKIYKVISRGLILLEGYNEDLEHIGLANFIAKYGQ